MKFQNIIQEVYFGSWAITREGWGAVHAIVKSKLDGSVQMPKADADPDMDMMGNQIPKMEVTDDGVAIVPICGTLIHHASLLEKMCGACSYDDIKRDLDAAMGVRDLQKIVLSISSPGGMCMGCQEIATKVANIRNVGIRIEAITDTQICSAAYHIAAACDKISCTPSAVVGSIGVISPFLDQSLRYEMQGVKLELITSGPLKGTGWPGTSLTDDQRAYLQGTVDKYAGMFKDHVQKYRPIDDESMQGQYFIGSSALDAGLVDAIVEDMQSAMCVDSEDLTDGD